MKMQVPFSVILTMILSHLHVNLISGMALFPPQTQKDTELHQKVCMFLDLVALCSQSCSLPKDSLSAAHRRIRLTSRNLEQAF